MTVPAAPKTNNRSKKKHPRHKPAPATVKRPLPATVSRPGARSKRGTNAKTPTLERLLADTGAVPFVTREETLVPYRKSRGTYVPLLCDVGTTTVTVAVTTATTLITSLDLYPGKTKKLFKTYDQISAWCAQHDIDQLAEIVDATAAGLIKDIAGVSDLAPGFTLAPDAHIKTGALQQSIATGDRDRRRTHYLRNAIVSLRAATVLTRTRKRSERVTDDSLALGLPVLPGLEDRKGRPLTDEEILLARLLVEIDNAEGAEPGPAITYLVGENGVRPTASATRQTTALDDRARPTKITVPGVWEFEDRTVKLTSYAAATLPRLLRQLRPGDQPLTYTGSDPTDKKAHSSISGVILRHLQRAGVADPEVTAKSLNFWRVQHTLVRTGDMRKARKYHGGQTINVLEDLKLDVNENDAGNGWIHLQRRDNGELVATVSSKSFYDRSFTDKGRPQRDKQRNKKKR